MTPIEKMKQLADVFFAEAESFIESQKKKAERPKWIRIGKLEWLKDCSEESMDWFEAKEWCEVRGGRLPTRAEMINLYDNHQEECQKLTENDPGRCYWTATQYSATVAWYVTLSNGSTHNYNKATGSYCVRCVRSVK